MLNWIIGWWLIIDAAISLIMHLPDKRQTWAQDHSIRLIRGATGLALILTGWKNIRRLK